MSTFYFLNNIIKFLYENGYISIFAIIIPVISVIFINNNTNKQINNQNRNTYKPRLKLTKTEIIENEFNDSYSFLCSSHNHIIKQNENHNETDEFIKILSLPNVNNIHIKLVLKNIGTGLAKDIVFYNLDDTSKLVGVLSHEKSKIQESFSSLEIEKDNFFEIYLDVSYIKTESGVYSDYFSLICCYKDLFNNRYESLVNVFIRDFNSTDFDVENNKSLVFQYIQGDTEKYSQILDKENNYKKIKVELDKK